jgi:glycosyltransferase involved in cell wall biosynthesis
MQTILFNDNLISVRAQRGIARYFGKIVEGAGRLLGPAASVCSPESWAYGQARHLPSLRFKGSWRLGLQDKIAALAATALHPAVIFHAYYGDVNTRTAHVYPVYDMLHEWTAPANHPFIAQKRRCLQRAAALLPISDHSAKDLQHFYPDLDPARIHPIPLGVDSSFFVDSPPPALEARPYFLYVGHRTPYKNFYALLEAFGRSQLAQNFDLKVLSPLQGFSSEEQACMQHYAITQQVQLLLSPPDTVLRQHYAGAFAFVYPSRYEGFGLPILEAFASRTLVCTSNLSSMPELGGTAALYFDPQSVESIAACLRQAVALTPLERQPRIEQGVERARFYSWERCILRTLAVLRHLAEPGASQ